MAKFTNNPAVLFSPLLDGPDAKALKAAYALIEESHAAIEAQKRATVFKCGSCLAMTPIADLEYVQTYWYTEPHGCTGGDYWNAGEGKVLCPACGVESRTAYSPGLAELSGFFGSHSDRRKG